MPAIMTRFPGDAVLPLDPADPSLQFALPALSGESSASTIMSPLTLPRGVSGYFDQAVSSRSNYNNSRIHGAAGNFLNGPYPAVYSPLSPGVRGPPKPQSVQYLSPNLTPITREMEYQIQQHQQQRSASMSPTCRMASRAGAAGRPRSTITSPPRSTPAAVPVLSPVVNGMPPDISTHLSNGAIPSISAASAAHPRSVSADAATAPSHVLMIRRLVQQNSRIREAWEAERKYMEANRERVEEVYKEERALMEEQRAEWESEKESLLRKIALLQQQVAGLCGYHGAKNDAFAKGKSRHGVGGNWNMSPESMRSSASSRGSVLPGQRNGVLPGSGDPLQVPSRLFPLGDAASTGVPQTSFAHHPTSHFSPSKQPESSPFIPMANNHGMVSPPKEEVPPVPIVDVQEIIPTSEGIPLKASAVQKTTFSDGPSPPASNPTSRTASPPADPSKGGVPNRPVKEQTLQVLAADEVDRLTMHAGHTPNHSLSVLPTVTATTASSSGESTPTLQPVDFTDSSAAASSSEPTEPPTTQRSETSNNSVMHLEEAGFDACPDDVPLKGPLMVRNMPAHDEIFFRRLSDKLEEVSKGTEAAVPAVLRDLSDPELSCANQPTNGDGEAAAEKADSEKSSPRSRDGEEIEIPLKLKASNNFGAPFGVFR